MQDATTTETICWLGGCRFMLMSYYLPFQLPFPFYPFTFLLFYLSNIWCLPFLRLGAFHLGGLTAYGEHKLSFFKHPFAIATHKCHAAGGQLECDGLTRRRLSGVSEAMRSLL